MVRKTLTVQEEEVAIFVEGDLMLRGKRQPAGGTNGLHHEIGGVGVERVGPLSRKAQEDGAVGGVALAGQRQRAVEIDLDAFRGRQQSLVRDRTSVVSGKSVSVRVDIGGLRFIKKK